MSTRPAVREKTKTEKLGALVERHVHFWRALQNLRREPPSELDLRLQSFMETIWDPFFSQFTSFSRVLRTSDVEDLFVENTLQAIGKIRQVAQDQYFLPLPPLPTGTRTPQLGAEFSVERGTYVRLGAAPVPVRQVLLDALDKLKKDRRGFVSRIQEGEARLKISLDLQNNFKHPITNDVLRAQFEALQRESSALANDLAAARSSLANVDRQIEEVSARIVRAGGRLDREPEAPPKSKPLPVTQPPSQPRDDRERPLREEPARTLVEEEHPSSIGAGVYVAGAAAVVLLIGIAVTTIGDRP